MPTASSYTRKLRALTDARNTKVQYPGNIVNTYRPGLSLTCDANMVPSVVTIAGIPNSSGYSGDNGPATQARLNNPYSVCTDSIGNTYIADQVNERVRKIDTSGKITTLPISITAFESTVTALFGITIDANDILYVADPYAGGADNNNGRILCFNTRTNVIVRTITGNRSNLYLPRSLWIANNTLYIGNIRGGDVPFIGNVSTYSLSRQEFSGTRYQFYFPLTVAVGPDGSIYSIEQPGNTIPGYTPRTQCVHRYKNGVYSIFAGISQTSGGSGDGGPATLATLSNPSSVFVDTVGNVYICDTGNRRIRMVTPDGIIQTVVGGGTTYNEGGAPLEILTAPTSMWFDTQGRMYFTDEQDVVRRINSVYKPSWWDPFQYQKICKPCNAIVRPPPLPPVPTILRLRLEDGANGQGISADGLTGTAIPVIPSNTLLHVYIDYMEYPDRTKLALRFPNFNDEFKNIVSASLNNEVLAISYPFMPTEAVLSVDLNTYDRTSIPIILTFEGPVNSIYRIYAYN